MLEDLRSRAATLVAAAALVTGFLGEATLTRADAIAALSWTGLAIAAFVLTAASSFAILWPIHVRFSVGAGDILALVERRAATPHPIGATEATKPDSGLPRPEPHWPDISKPDTRGG